MALAATLRAQGPAVPPAPWRGAGPTPCVGADGGIFSCPPAPRTVAVRAGRLFDSKTGQMLDEAGGRAFRRAHHRRRTGGAGQDSGGRAGDRPQPGDGAAGPHRRAHAHVQHARTEDDDRERDAHRRAERAGRSAGGLHGGARHELARQRIRRRRDPRRHQPGPHRRPQVSGVDAGHRVGRDHPATAPANPLASTVVRSVDEARAAVREQIRTRRRLDQAVPGGAYSFTPHGRGAIRHHVSAARAAGADRRNASPRPQGRLPRARRRGTERTPSSPAATPSSTRTA